MFVHDHLGAPIRLARGGSVGERSLASINLIARYGIHRRRLELESWPTDSLLDVVAVEPLWLGTSVCAAGSVHAPLRPPYVTDVSLEVGASRLAMVVSGDRRWERGPAGLQVSDPEPFEALPMTFDLAFGGFFDIPPGPAPGTGLPHPGGTMTFPLNPTGRGLVSSEAEAVGTLLPNIEWVNQRMRRCLDQPEPAGFGLCPDLTLLRVGAAGMRSPEDWIHGALRSKHPGGGRCIFDEVRPTAVVELRGMSRSGLRFEVPAPPLKTHVRHRGVDRAVRPRLRAILIDSEREKADLVWGAAFSWPRQSLAGEAHVHAA